MKYARISEPTSPESSQLKFNYATKDEGEAAQAFENSTAEQLLTETEV